LEAKMLPGEPNPTHGPRRPVRGPFQLAPWAGRR
jgi:hypothetical protein